MSSEAPQCAVCRWAPVFAKARCAACYFFLRRHGRDKTEDEVVRAGLRFERRLIRTGMTRL